MNCSTNSVTPRRRVLVIPAAGAGVRFRELGKNYPKCVLPVEGTPIIVTSLKMIATNTGAFDLVVIPCANESHRDAIEAALAPHDFGVRVETIVVQLDKGITPSPAISLAAAFQYAEKVFDITDATVFLSDMLPSNQKIADRAAFMLPDTWGVTPRQSDDFARWCMVQTSENVDGTIVQFFDKPEVAPPTNLAACGVYCYGDTTKYMDALDRILARRDVTSSEIQFSNVVSESGVNNRVSVFNINCFKDFGTLEEYLANKGISKCRSFNRITEGVGIVVKSSTDYEKIRDEAVWLQNAPDFIKRFVPRVEAFDLMGGSVTLEKIRSSNLRDVALYLDRSHSAWTEIFKHVNKFNVFVSATASLLSSDLRIELSNRKFWDKMAMKTRDRYAKIGHDAIRPEERDMVEEWLNGSFFTTIAELQAKEMRDDPVVYYHGDLHFANMFYCFHYKELKVIDPRGEPRGSQFYDLAKLCHSVFGRYDYIDADLYSIVGDKVMCYDRGHENIEKAFRETIFDQLPVSDRFIVLNLTASLFLSMIPLHADRPEHCRLFFKEFQRMRQMAIDEIPLDFGV